MFGEAVGFSLKAGKMVKKGWEGQLDQRVRSGLSASGKVRSSCSIKGEQGATLFPDRGRNPHHARFIIYIYYIYIHPRIIYYTSIYPPFSICHQPPPINKNLFII